MNSRFRPTLLLLALALGACNLPQPQPDTTRHFTLSDPEMTAPAPDAVRVVPVQTPGYLHRREMAVRVADREVIFLEDIRWAESLDFAITQILRARLGSIGGGAVVTVRVQRCELVRSDGNTVELAANFTIEGTAGGKPYTKDGSFNATPRKWGGQDYGKLVGLIHDAVTELGDAIAADVKR
ncbi:MAG TPA: ABC-type transport auxiliary lipoprotein family protein [Candidatus Didemnitutus sp.]|nr:ABC-type transport auxiliary lipoprotein family protein [Candidatus Didemnitutus sp.]